MLLSNSGKDQTTIALSSLLQYWLIYFLFPVNFDIFFLFTQSAVHQSFAKADNLGEISAKAQVSISVFLFCLPFLNLFIRGLYYEYLIYCRFKQCALTSLVSCLLPLLICGLGAIKGCYFFHDEMLLFMFCCETECWL